MGITHRSIKNINNKNFMPIHSKIKQADFSKDVNI